MTLDSPIHQLGADAPVDAAPGMVTEDAAATLTKAMRQTTSATNHWLLQKLSIQPTRQRQVS
jgi:hypothetical protein